MSISWPGAGRGPAGPTSELVHPSRTEGVDRASIRATFPEPGGARDWGGWIVANCSAVAPGIPGNRGYNCVMRYALSLDEICPDDVGRVGSKAATLARLRQEGLPIPDGFVVPSDLFELVAEQADLDILLREADRSTPEHDDALVERFAAALARARVPVGAIDALHGAFDRVDEISGAVVVRSSAIGEDRPTASAAGQYLTIHNVRDFPTFLSALRECWLSLFSPAALRYRRRFDPHAAPRMAVLVQAQIPCEVAGTLFTVDPLSGADQIVIEATWGQGEAIAQGEVVPDRYVLSPLTLAELAGTRVAEKLHQRVLDTRTGTRLALVPEWRRRRASLGRGERGALALLGLRVAEILGAAQDVEWGRSAGHWWIFQSRPITTIPSPTTNGQPAPGAVDPARIPDPLQVPEQEGGTYGNSVASNGHGSGRERRDPSRCPPSDRYSEADWTSGFLDERLVEPVSPLGWSVLREGLEEIAFGETLRMLGVDAESLRPLTRLWNGHPYAKVDVYEALYKLFPDWLLPEDARRFFPGGDTGRRKRAPRPKGILDPRVWVGLARVLLAHPTIVSPFQNDGAWDRFEPRYVAAVTSVARRVDRLESAASPRLEEVLQVLGELERHNRALLRIHRWSLTYAELWYALLRRFATALVGSRQANDLAVAAVSHLNDQSMRMNRAMAALRRELAEGNPADVVLPRFLEEFGHRSFSLDIVRPPFSADASQVLALLEPVSGPHAPSMAAPEPGDASGVVGSIIAPLASLAHRYARLREDQRFAWQRGLAQVRRLYLVAGRILADTGRVNRAEDVFYLTSDEVREAATRGLDFHRTVAERHEVLAAQHDLYNRLGRDSYPAFLRGDRPLVEGASGRPAARPLSVRPHIVELAGVPVSPGMGRGKARVVLRASDLARVRSGEVLVARSADPGWTAVFDRLSGLVAESGGQLSHASVVAREFQLPAVVAVPRATDLVRTGDELEVDGRNGIVRITRRDRS